MKNNAKAISMLGVYVACAMVLAYIEVLLPPLVYAVPGIKMGLPNVIIIFLLYRKNLSSALVVSFVRMVLVALLFGNGVSFLYSLAGGMLSFWGMVLLKKLNVFSAVGISVVGGVLHNLGQLLMAIVLLNTTQLGYYMVVLAISGTVAGIAVGLCSALLIRKVPRKLVE